MNKKKLTTDRGATVTHNYMPNKVFYFIFFALSLGFSIGFVLEPTFEHAVYLSLCAVIGLAFFVMDRKMRPEPETETKEVES